MNMERVVRFFGGIGVAALLAAGPAMAQPGHEGHQGMGAGKGKGPGMSCPACMKGEHAGYDPATESTVTGVVEAVQEMAGKGGPGGVHLSLRSGEDVFQVHLGPVAFLVENDFRPEVGDTLRIVGARLREGEGHVLLARQLSRDERTLVLRDERGKPVWSGKMKEGCCGKGSP